ncbi:MAG: hypothetical protein ACYC6N_21555 [Pirellulaceae bacterium]
MGNLGPDEVVLIEVASWGLILLVLVACFFTIHFLLSRSLIRIFFLPLVRSRSKLPFYIPAAIISLYLFVLASMVFSLVTGGKTHGQRAGKWVLVDAGVYTEVSQNMFIVATCVEQASALAFGSTFIIFLLFAYFQPKDSHDDKDDFVGRGL